MTLSVFENYLIQVSFDNQIFDDNHPVLLEAENQILEYFAGKREIFEIPLKFIGTYFQKKVWQELMKIPFGETICYQELARRIGDIKMARAVGNANGKNPISIVVPCHRVIAKNGTIGGFTGGIEKKIFLLNLENHNF
jgi:methylated-DNA-[protein]-cysteine S-methyltransferase